MSMEVVGVWKTKQKKSLETLENTSTGKQMANIGKRSVDIHGEMISLHGHSISINMFQKLMADSGTETFALKGNNALPFFFFFNERLRNLTISIPRNAEKKNWFWKKENF